MTKSKKTTVFVLGASGSLGEITLNLLKKHQKFFDLVGFSGHKNQKKLQTLQANFPHAKVFLTSKGSEKEELQKLLKNSVDLVINLISGIGGTPWTKLAIENQKLLLTANKEGLLANSDLAKNNLGKIIPLDSEHNAIFEILQKFPSKKIEKIYLPCSGGPFWEIRRDKKLLNSKTSKVASKHPRWAMGPKISIESALLINKGFEIIEAALLFQVPLEKIQVVLDQNCMIHGAVEFKNASKNPQKVQANSEEADTETKEIFGYCGPPSMSEHIENSLTSLLKTEISPASSHARIQKISSQVLEESVLPPSGELRGIDLVTSFFKKSPTSSEILEFLEFEENLIHEFQQEKIKFLEILEKLQEFYPKSGPTKV